MKRTRFLYCLICLVVLMSPIFEAKPSFAQGDGSPHAAIVASIPSLINFAEQADTTYVGEVEGSYAYIAFVIQETYVVIYVCDSVGVSEWIRGEVVDGAINVATESGNVVIAATVSDGVVSGTVTLPTDDDGTPAVAHNFTTAVAVPGETGLARAEDEATISGWIVTEDGIRGFRKRRAEREHQEQCSQWNQEWNRAVNRMHSYADNTEEYGYWFLYAADLAKLMVDSGCVPPAVI